MGGLACWDGCCANDWFEGAMRSMRQIRLAIPCVSLVIRNFILWRTNLGLRRLAQLLPSPYVRQVRVLSTSQQADHHL